MRASTTPAGLHRRLSIVSGPRVRLADLCEVIPGAAGDCPDRDSARGRAHLPPLRSSSSVRRRRLNAVTDRFQRADEHRRRRTLLLGDGVH